MKKKSIRESSKIKEASIHKEDIDKMQEELNKKDTKNIKDKIDPDEVKKIKEKYENKSQDELMGELKNLSEKIPQKDDIFEKLRPFLNEKQKSKLDKIINELNK